MRMKTVYSTRFNSTTVSRKLLIFTSQIEEPMPNLTFLKILELSRLHIVIFD
uniref:Uncharacterized protein n=1 Tax=Arion vulgaris TaxID=1028688 RepID=A0A0B6ZEQ8_9EUPU